MYLVAEPVRLLLEVFGAYDKRHLSPDMAKKRPKYDGFTLNDEMLKLQGQMHKNYMMFYNKMFCKTLFKPNRHMIIYCPNCQLISFFKIVL